MPSRPPTKTAMRRHEAFRASSRSACLAWRDDCTPPLGLVRSINRQVPHDTAGVTDGPPCGRAREGRRHRSPAPGLARYLGRENIFPLATASTHAPLEGMTGPIRVLRIVLSDFELSSAADVLAFHGGSVLYPNASALLTAESDRRG